MKFRARRGLTLLEALVALAIIATSFGAILEMQAQLVRSLSAVQRAHERAQWRLNLVEVAASLDAETLEGGEFVWSSDARVNWRKSSERAVRPNRLGQRTRGGSTVTLADVELEAVVKGRSIARETMSVVVATTPPEPEETASPAFPGGAGPF